ncbi:hypothetical protein CHUAL_006926 [Chamberlinius hualienensis]
MVNGGVATIEPRIYSFKKGKVYGASPYHTISYTSPANSGLFAPNSIPWKPLPVITTVKTPILMNYPPYYSKKPVMHNPMAFPVHYSNQPNLYNYPLSIKNHVKPAPIDDPRYHHYKTPSEYHSPPNPGNILYYPY